MAGPRGDRQSLAMREVAGPLRPHLGLEMSVSSLLGAPVIRPSPPSHATAFLPVRAGGVGIHPQSHAGVVEIGRWCCRLWSSWFGFDVSVAAIRRGPNTSLPGWRSRGSKRCDTRSERLRRPVSGAPRRRPRRRARRRRQTWHRRGCPMTELVQIVAGLSQAARDGARQRASILD